MKLTRRLLALLLVLCLSLSNVAPAFATGVADDEQTEPVATVEETVQAADYAADDAAESEEPATTEGSEETTGATVAEEPAVGTQENPLYPEWNWNDAQTEATVSITVPANSTYYYYVMFGGLMLSVNDGEAVMVNGSRYMPELHSITNEGDEEAVYTVKLSVPAGTMDNPEVTWLGWNEVSLEAGDQDGYYYAYTAEGTGTVTLYFASVTEGVEADIVVTNKNTGAQRTLLADGVDNNGLELQLSVTEGDELVIQVVVLPDAEWNIAAADIAWVGSFTYPLGSQQNPIFPEWNWNEEYTEASVTVTAPVGTTYYGVNGGNGMLLTINGGEGVVLTSANPRMPAVFSIVNDGTEAADYALHISWPAGSQMNPEVLEYLGWVDVSLAAGDGDGHYYTYTAEATGSITFYIGSITEGVEGDIIVYNENTYEYKTLTGDGVDNYGLELTVNVNEGDVLSIQVMTQPVNWEYPAADIGWMSFFSYPLGSEQNPINPEWTWDEDYIEATATVTVPAGATYYFAGNDGMYLSIDDGEAFLLKSMMPRMPATFTITNEGTEAAEYNLRMYHPAGSQMNPEELYSRGLAYAALEEGDSDGYYYTFVADYDGTLYFNIEDITEGVVADIAVNNLRSYDYNTLQADGVNGVMAMEVLAGDELIIQVAVLPDDNWQYAAAEILWNFNYAAGTEMNPMVPDWQWNDKGNEASAVVTIPAGETWYIAVNFAGMLLTVDDNEAVPVVGDRWNPYVFPISNSTDAEASYNLSLAWPEGSVDNPAELADGDNAIAMEAGDPDGHYFTYTAPDRGTLTVSVSADCGWEYFINNMTAYAYGDKHWSDEEPVVDTQVLNVNKGDEIVVFVAAYDPDNMWSAPAGTVTVNVAFEAAYGSESNPVTEFYMGMGAISAEVPADTTVYFNVFGVGGMIMDIYDADALTLTVNGVEYTADEDGIISALLPQAMGRMPVSFTLTNNSEVDASIAMVFTYPLGSMNNPAPMQLGKNAVALEADNTGYYYTYTATGDGALIVSVSADCGWQYCVNNMTSYVYGDNHWSDDAPAVASEVVPVKTGDEIQVFVTTYDPDNMWSAPAGNITVSVSFTEAMELVGGKSTTFKFVHPETGKTVKASLVNWSIEAYVDGIKEDAAPYAQINASGKLTTYKSADSVMLKVVGTLKSDSSVAVGYVVNVYPAATSVNITKNLGVDSEGNNYYQNVTGTTVALDVAEASADALPSVTYGFEVYPYNAMQDVKWTVSGKIVTLTENADGTVTLTPVWNAKTNSCKTGTVTVTATAADGSGKKASFKLNVTALVTSISIETKDGKNMGELDGMPVIYATAGQTLNLKAVTNANATNKAVTWECYSSYAKITAAGKLTISRDIPYEVYIPVEAVAKDGSYEYGQIAVIVKPLATNVYAFGNGQLLSNTTRTWNITPEENRMISLSAMVYPYDANQDVVWTTSSAKVAKIVTNENGTYVEFLKTGKVTITATVNDGSKEKTSFTLNVVKGIDSLTMANQNVVKGKSLNLAKLITINPTDASNKALKWEIIGNAHGATLSAAGVLKTNKVDVSNGPVTITICASVKDGWGATPVVFTVTVNPKN